MSADSVENYTFLLDIFARIHDGTPKSSYRWPAKTYFAIARKKLGSEYAVQFPGIRSDVSAILQGMDVLIFSSLHEGLPLLSLIEAQTVRCRVSCFVPNTVSRATAIIQLVHFIPLAEAPQI